MNLDDLEKKLNQCQQSINTDTTIHDISNNIKNITHDEDTLREAREIYYDTLPEKEKNYQIANDKYKDLISQFSHAYVEMSDFYVGPELPREETMTFLDSQKDLQQLYFLFMMLAVTTCNGFTSD